jgi:hypothetical protein
LKSFADTVARMRQSGPYHRPSPDDPTDLELCSRERERLEAELLETRSLLETCHGTSDVINSLNLASREKDSRIEELQRKVGYMTDIIQREVHNAVAGSAEAPTSEEAPKPEDSPKTEEAPKLGHDSSTYMARHNGLELFLSKFFFGDRKVTTERVCRMVNKVDAPRLRDVHVPRWCALLLASAWNDIVYARRRKFGCMEPSVFECRCGDVERSWNKVSSGIVAVRSRSVYTRVMNVYRDRFMPPAGMLKRCWTLECALVADDEGAEETLSKAIDAVGREALEADARDLAALIGAFNRELAAYLKDGWSYGAFSYADEWKEVLDYSRSLMNWLETSPVSSMG